MDDFARVAYEALEQGVRTGNLRYREMFFNPDYHYPQGATYETVVEGILTNIPLHRELVVDAKFVEGGTSIHYLEAWMAQHKR